MAATRVKDVKGMPIGFENTSAIGNFFALRELELSTKYNKSVRVIRVEQLVSVALPVSKTDPMALGCVRTWGCTCDGQRETMMSCPSHAAAAQKDMLDNVFGDKSDQEEFPFSPGADGTGLSKAQMVSAIRRS